MNKAKSYIITFTVQREFDADEFDELSLKDVKEMALQDFYDDAHHGNLTPLVKVVVKR